MRSALLVGLLGVLSWCASSRIAVAQPEVRPLVLADGQGLPLQRQVSLSADGTRVLVVAPSRALNPLASGVDSQLVLLRTTDASVIWSGVLSQQTAASDVVGALAPAGDRVMLLDRTDGAHAVRVADVASGTSGVTTPALSWFFAEGATGAVFDTYLLIANPNDSPAEVTARFVRAFDPAEATTALPIERTYVIAPHSRRTIWVAQEAPELRSTQVSAQLTSTQPIVAERTMWWPGPTAATWRENHSEVGATASGLSWAVADILADTASGGWDTFLLLATAEPAIATARVAMACSDGMTDARDYALALNRTTLWLRHEFPLVVGRQCAATVESLPTRVTSSLVVPLQRTPLCVEKAMYHGIGFAAGGVSLATRLPDPVDEP